jgi:hypothetical protein
MRSNLQPVNDFSADQVAVDDFIDVMVVDVGVPRAFRIDHHDRAFFAAVEAAGLVDADLALAAQVQVLDAAFRMFLGVLCAFVKAARTSFFALIQAKKYVVFIVRLVSHGLLSNFAKSEMIHPA